VCQQLPNSLYLWLFTIFQDPNTTTLTSTCTTVAATAATAAAAAARTCRYRKLLLGVDLTKNFFFSYSYNLAHTLQQNHTQAAATAAAATATAAAATAAAADGTPTTAAASGVEQQQPGEPQQDDAAAAAQSAAAAAAAAVATAAAAAAGWDVYDSSMFVWNAYLTRPLRAAIQSSRWTVPLVHGYLEQRQVRGCVDLGV
jgi:hypothetical protein